jgi:penicillin-binding protein 1A
MEALLAKIFATALALSQVTTTPDAVKAMDDPQAMTSENKAFRGIHFADLQTAYRQFCKNEKVPVPSVVLRSLELPIEAEGLRCAK